MGATRDPLDTGVRWWSLVFVLTDSHNPHPTCRLLLVAGALFLTALVPLASARAPALVTAETCLPALPG